MASISTKLTLTQYLLNEISRLGLPKTFLESLLTLYFGVSQEELDSWFYGDEASETGMQTLNGLWILLQRFPDTNQTFTKMHEFLERQSNRYKHEQIGDYYGLGEVGAYHEIRGV